MIYQNQKTPYFVSIFEGMSFSVLKVHSHLEMDEYSQILHEIL